MSADRHYQSLILSLELKLVILDCKGSTDIWRLRLTTRSFRQVPIGLWYRLTIRELPWLWEAWSTVPYSYWATTTATEIRRTEEKHELEKRIMEPYTALVEDEMQELTDQFEVSRQQLDEAAEAELANLRHKRMVPLPVLNTLPRDRPN